MQTENIIVGSKNPVKIASALAGFESMFPDRSFTTAGFAVESGVSDQPMSSEETLQGAVNRVSQLPALAPESQFFVGMEGGIEIIDDRWFASAWMVVLDHQGRRSQSKSALFALPPKVKQLVESGLELGLANDQVFAEKNSKHAGGAIGSLTAGKITRHALYEHAMVAALIPFKNTELFFN